MARGYCDKIDQQNMAFEDTMEPTYLKWAERLGWRTEIFDNTNLTIEEAYKKLFDLIVR
ncbi:hypothetical protein SDC9_178287 [bioreactor metagenome]|uniref:Thymidylate kinase n=1 Tax=bioreactor metagenome TaxID=1076179 RepID=A0A645GX34_9ZZZZ